MSEVDGKVAEEVKENSEKGTKRPAEEKAGLESAKKHKAEANGEEVLEEEELLEEEQFEDEEELVDGEGELCEEEEDDEGEEGEGGEEEEEEDEEA